MGNTAARQRLKAQDFAYISRNTAFLSRDVSLKLFITILAFFHHLWSPSWGIFYWKDCVGLLHRADVQMPGWQNGTGGEENDLNQDFTLDYKFEGVQKDDNNDDRFYIRFWIWRSSKRSSVLPSLRGRRTSWSFSQRKWQTWRRRMERYVSGDLNIISTRAVHTCQRSGVFRQKSKLSNDMLSYFPLPTDKCQSIWGGQKGGQNRWILGVATCRPTESPQTHCPAWLWISP